MDLASIVKTYLQQAGSFDTPLPVSKLGVPPSELEPLLSAWDEDYQISRYMSLSYEPASSPLEQIPQPMTVNGYSCTHIMFRSGIERFLASK